MAEESFRTLSFEIHEKSPEGRMAEGSLETFSLKISE